MLANLPEAAQRHMEEDAKGRLALELWRKHEWGCRVAEVLPSAPAQATGSPPAPFPPTGPTPNRRQRLSPAHSGLLRVPEPPVVVGDVPRIGNQGSEAETQGNRR